MSDWSSDVCSSDLDRISPSRDNRAYRIDVDAGDRLFIDLQQMSATADRATFRLIDPFGRQIVGPVNAGDYDTGALTWGGTYTLLVEGRTALSNWPVDFRLAIYDVTATAPVPITLDGSNPEEPQVETGVHGNALTLRGVDYEIGRAHV